ncbi:unnamed protein product [Fusarium venenatum]|uniref:Heterokaryon incompatibility domain-containing protein n=1 Tax=Fusarium venenatum TaxID=56646 RepID=A0A2L2SUY5_9HYPO|nr:uncharacterized protein FVRRES_04515 [Fusarium venenatum]CEI60079.1 unnamed protein product [Fusarium venenatum]
MLFMQISIDILDIRGCNPTSPSICFGVFYLILIELVSRDTLNVTTVGTADILAGRCLISSPEGMIWQCKCTTWRDDVESCFDIDTWTLDLVGSPLTALQDNPLRSYTACVEIYSGRRLSFLRDKVVAFEGISAALERRLESSFKYSMPLRYLDWALLWVERDALVGNEFQQRYDKQKRTEFPSWSWCGWDLPVHWPRLFLEGTLFNLRDWFASRAAGCHFRSQVTVDEVTEPMDHRSYPCLEGNLLFQTFTGHFSLSRKTMSGPVVNTSQETHLRQFGIADSFGDWCGTITLDKSWYNQVGGIFEFAAISEAKDFSMEELDTWTYYVSEERQQAEWYCFYALMIRCEETKGGPVAERVGLAKNFQSSFFFFDL